MARATGRGKRRTMKLKARRARTMTRDLSALRFRFSTLEFLDQIVPVAALAQKPLHHFSERAVAAARLKLPRRPSAHFARRVGRSGGDRGAQHRREIGKVIADVERLIEAERQFLQHAGAGVELVGGALVQLGDAELARAAGEGGGAAAGQQDYLNAHPLRQLRRQSVADVELLDLTLLAGV